MPEENAKTPSAAPPPGTRSVGHGKRQFILAPRRGTQALTAGLRPLSGAAARALIGQLPGLELMRVLWPRRGLSPLSLTPDEACEVYIGRIDPDRVELVRQLTHPQLLVEEDTLLEYGTPAGIARPAPARLSSWNTRGALETRQIRIRVLGDGDRPLTSVGVTLSGEGFPQEGRTDKRGEVALPLITLPGQPARSLLVSAPGNHWDQYVSEPQLSDSEVNVVRLRALEETVAGFPVQFRYAWGQILMGLDRIPETLAGQGVRIALVDSGADTGHSLLRHIRYGVDLTERADTHSWAQDVIGHGTHCAGIIAARDESGKMLRGFVPEAEIHVLKVFPGGRFSNLLQALDYCIEFDIDLVNLSLTSAERSQAVEQKIEEAALHGIACIVAAGNSAGSVQYPASSLYTLAVGAVGHLSEYPDGTWDASTVAPGLVAPDGVFAPKWSPLGPEIAVCAPGVAIVSTVPGGFESLSGTSMAAPHVTGLGALLLAHHPTFQGPLRSRTQQRVVALFAMIRSLCVPYPFGPRRTGAGLPRLHPIEAYLRPSIHDRSSAGSHGNGGTIASSMAASGGAPLGMFTGPMMAGAPVAMGTVVDPLYVQAALVGQAWPVQALFESLRRQYGGG